MKVFLGGTCNESKWRESIMPLLDKVGIDYFNPVVEDWTPECQDEEIKQREICDFCLYTITPRMTGVYSIGEVVDDSNKRPEKTILCIIEKDGEIESDKFQLKSLHSISKMVTINGGKSFNNIESVVDYLLKEGENGI